MTFFFSFFPWYTSDTGWVNGRLLVSFNTIQEAFQTNHILNLRPPIEPHAALTEIQIMGQSNMIIMSLGEEVHLKGHKAISDIAVVVWGGAAGVSTDDFKQGAPDIHNVT